MLREPVGERLPRRAGVDRPPHRALAVRRAPVLVALERQQVGGVGSGRVGDDREPEVHAGDARHRRPRSAAVVAAVDAAVVLQVEPLGVAGVAGHLVDALAELELGCLGQERRRRCRRCWPATSRRRRRSGRRRPPRSRSSSRSGSSGWTSTVCRHSPPPPGCHCGRCGWSHSPRTSEKLRPPSSLRNSAAGSTPA